MVQGLISYAQGQLCFTVKCDIYSAWMEEGTCASEATGLCSVFCRLIMFERTAADSMFKIMMLPGNQSSGLH
jgi:hypothetical protein